MSATHKPGSRPPKGDKRTYRGVIIRKPATASRFTLGEIRRAIRHALAKHAGSLNESG